MIETVARAMYADRASRFQRVHPDPDPFTWETDNEGYREQLRDEAREFVRVVIACQSEDRALAQSYLDKAEEDYTWVDPEDIKRLARAVLSK